MKYGKIKNIHDENPSLNSPLSFLLSAASAIEQREEPKADFSPLLFAAEQERLAAKERERAAKEQEKLAAKEREKAAKEQERLAAKEREQAAKEQERLAAKEKMKAAKKQTVPMRTPSLSPEDLEALNSIQDP